MFSPTLKALVSTIDGNAAIVREIVEIVLQPMPHALSAAVDETCGPPPDW